MTRYLFFLFFFLLSSCTQNTQSINVNTLKSKLIVSQSAGVQLKPFAFVFDHPMVTKKNLLQNARPIFNAAPHLVGEGYWLDESTYMFVPSQNQRVRDEYKLTIPRNLRAQDGSFFAVSVDYLFNPDLPSVTHISPGLEAGLGPMEMIVIEWNRRPFMGDVKAFVRVDVFDPALGQVIKGWPVSMNQIGNNKNSLVPQRPYPKGGKVNVYVSKRILMGQDERVYSYQVVPPFVLSSIGCLPVCDPSSFVDLTFSTAVSMEVLVGMLHFDPAVDDIKVLDMGQGKKWSVTGLFTPASKYSLSFDPSFKDEHGQTFAGDSLYAIAFKDVEDELDIKNYPPVYTMNFPISQFAVEIKNFVDEFLETLEKPLLEDPIEEESIKWGYSHRLEKLGETDTLSRDEVVVDDPTARNKKITITVSPHPLMGDDLADPTQSIALGAMVQGTDRVLLETFFYSIGDKPVSNELTLSSIPDGQLFFRKNGEGKLYYRFLVEYDSATPDFTAKNVAVKRDVVGDLVASGKVKINYMLVVKDKVAALSVYEKVPTVFMVESSSFQFSTYDVGAEGFSPVLDKNGFSVFVGDVEPGIYTLSYEATLKTPGLYPYAGLTLKSGNTEIYLPAWSEITIPDAAQ